MTRKNTARLLIVTLLVLTTGFGMWTIIGRANAVDELTIKIGYYGWPTSDYVEKAVFSASDLYDMGAYDEFYSYWDGSKRVAIDSSYGVPISTILDAAGIDQSSIANLDFWTADSGNGAFTSFTWKQLLGTKRYYFQDLATFFYYDEEGNLCCDEDEAWNYAQRVEPMMALEENWTWYELGTADATGTDNLGTANRFRLNFGQTSPTEKRTFNSAKMVHTIYVMFSGTPQLTSDETNIDAKVGSEHQLRITAAAVDEALEDVIQSNIEWSSSDTSVVEVDDMGNLTFKKKGTATIYATSGGATRTFTITVGDEGDEEPEIKPDTDAGTTTGDGQGSGKGKGKGNGSAKGQGTDPAKAGNNTSKQVKSEKVEVKRTGSKTFVLSDEASKNLRLALNKQAPAEEASMSTHQTEMDKDTEQLKVKKDDNNIAGAMGLINGIIAAEGSIFGFIRYRKQRWG